MYKILSGRLSAYFNIDGNHLNRYIQNKEYLTKTICEELILHDQLLVPTQDYLTASGLILLIGEKNFISLLELDKIRFLRLRGAFGYARGTEINGSLVTFGDPNKNKPQDTDIERSITLGLDTIGNNLKNKKIIHKLLTKQSIPLELSEIIDKTRLDSYGDLKQTHLWKNDYEFSNKDLLALPGVEKMQVRVIGPNSDVNDNIIDTLLSIALYNVEFYLSDAYGCNSISTGSPLGEMIDLKINRLYDKKDNIENLWNLLEVNDIPDLGKINFTENNYFNDFLKIVTDKKADSFRSWFHEKKHLNEKEIFKEYIGITNKTDWIKRLPSKTVRFAITTGIGFIPKLGLILSPVVSCIDAFIIEKVLSGKSPKYFFDELQTFKRKVIKK